MCEIESLEPRRLLAAVVADPAGPSAELPSAYVGYQLLGNTPDGGTLFAGVPGSFSSGTLQIRRITARGQIDDSYVAAVDGSVRRATADMQGRAIVATTFSAHVNRVSTVLFRLHRYTAQGAPDPSFSDDGRAAIPITYRPEKWALRSVTADGQGRIVVAIADPSKILNLVRFNANGRLDTTFGNQGFVVTGVTDENAAVALRDDGRIFVTSGVGHSLVRVFAFKANGDRRTDYGTRGILTVPEAYRTMSGTNPVLDDTGRVYVAIPEPGSGYPYHTPAPTDGLKYRSIIRLSTDGSLDTTYGDNGFAALDRRGDRTFFRISLMGVDSRGNLYAGAHDGTIARLRPSGQLDRKFDFDGLLQPQDDLSVFGYRTLTPAGLLSVHWRVGQITRHIEAPPLSIKADGTLLIAQQSAGENVRVSQSGRTIRVEVGNVRATYSARTITAIEAHLTDSADTFTYDAAASLTLFAGGGNDVLELARGAHTIHTGFGNDIVSSGDDHDDVYNAGGFDTIDLAGGKGTYMAATRYGIDGQPADAQAAITAAPGDRSVRFNTGRLDDRVHITGGRVSLFDTGGMNRFTINSAFGAQVSLGESGHTILNTGDGYDSINGGAGRVQIRSGRGNDFIRKTAGPSYIDAGGGEDSVSAGDGRDTLFGGGGNDRLDGNRGDDILHGQVGGDILTGGDGFDVAYVDDDDETDGIESILR